MKCGTGALFWFGKHDGGASGAMKWSGSRVRIMGGVQEAGGNGEDEGQSEWGPGR